MQCFNAKVFSLNHNLQKGYDITTTSSLTYDLIWPHLHINNHVKQTDKWPCEIQYVGKDHLQPEVLKVKYQKQFNGHFWPGIDF